MPATAKRVLSSGESVAAVCSEIGIGRTAYYDWIKLHPDFAKAVSEGKETAQRVWENIGRKGIVGELEKFSATPWMFVMKSRFKDDYSEQKQEDNLSAVELLVKMLADKDAK